MNVKIIVENGEKLIEADMEAYYEMQDKISALVKETFPQVRYCDVEVWGPGYYHRAEVKKALTEVLKEPKFQEMIGERIAKITTGKKAHV